MFERDASLALSDARFLAEGKTPALHTVNTDGCGFAFLFNLWTALSL